MAEKTAAGAGGMRSAEGVAQRVSRLDVELAAGSTGNLVPLVADWGLGLEAMECANVTSKSAAAAKDYAFGGHSENQVQRCDGGRSKVAHLFPKPEPGCHFGMQTQDLGPTLLMSSLVSVVVAATLDQ